MRSLTTDEWLAIFEPAGLLFSPVQTLHDVLYDEQARANNYIAEVDHPHLGKIPIPNAPYGLGKQVIGFRAAAPALGEHTDEVLAELGYTDSEIDSLKQSLTVK